MIPKLCYFCYYYKHVLHVMNLGSARVDMILIPFAQFWTTMRTSSSWTKRSTSWVSPTQRWRPTWWTCTLRWAWQHKYQAARGSLDSESGCLLWGSFTALLSASASDLLHGEEPEEHGGGEQADWGKEQGPVPWAIWPESGPDPKPGQHPPAHHGEDTVLNVHILYSQVIKANEKILLTLSKRT